MRPGHALKRIFLFDVNRILSWDVSRLLRWDVGRSVRRPIPAVLLKAFIGWIVAGIALAVIVPMTVQRGWHVSEWAVALVMLLSIAAFVAPDVRRMLASRSPDSHMPTPPR